MISKFVRGIGAACLAVGMMMTAFPAVAVTDGTFVDVFSGNEECPKPQPNGANPKTAVQQIIDAGSYCLAKFGNADQNNGEQGANSALSGVNILDNFTLTGAGSTSGTWSFDDQGEGFIVTHIVMKAGLQGFSVYDVTGLTGVLDWMTGPHLHNGSGTPQAISHLSFFGQAGTTTTVPVPAGLVLMLTALGGFGLLARRRAA